jgi:hypothetical protein
LTETTAGLSQPEQYIQSRLPTRLYSLCKIGSTEPEYTGVTREEKKSEKTHKNEEKSGHPTELEGRLTDEKLIATQAQQSQGRACRTC